MTIQICPSCLHWMREYTQIHHCTRCGYTKPRTAYNSFHGRRSLYPNRSAKPITKQFMDGFLRLFIYFMVMVSVLLVLAWSMDHTIWGVI